MIFTWYVMPNSVNNVEIEIDINEANDEKESG
jgi:hypothetical protein